MQFKIKDTTVKISFLFFFTVVFIITTNNQNLLSVLLFSLFHEFGHLFAIKLCNQQVEAFSLTLFGCEIQKSAALQGYRKDIFINIAGPVINLILFFIFIYAKDKDLAKINFILFLFNIMPIESFDGGNTLKNICLLNKSEVFANRLINTVSLTIVIPLFLLSIFCVVRFHTSYYLALILFILLVRLILKYNCFT